LLTFYRVSSKRGSLLSGVTGIVVHDHWKPYYTMKGVLHALCNAHHLRELKALVEIEKEQWACKMQRLLRRVRHAVNLAQERDVLLKLHVIELFQRSYDRILKEGLAFHEGQPALIRAPTEGQRKRRGRQRRRTGHNLLLRLSTRNEDVLRFLTDPDVPFTNNQAEQDGRMMKVKRRSPAASDQNTAPIPLSSTVPSSQPPKSKLGTSSRPSLRTQRPSFNSSDWLDHDPVPGQSPEIKRAKTL